jgi:predicted 2-oxoglutarate/Fe(II)-dependent dioxygenase YbiX
MEVLLGRIFTLDECDEIIKSINDEDWSHRKSNPEIHLYTPFDYYIVDYKNEFVDNKFKELIDLKFSISVNQVNIFVLKYLVGGMFGRHFDRNESKELNKDFVYNINVVLNDSFEGGEFYLDDEEFIGNKPGIAYQYSSTTWHEVKPVTSGTRYSMLCYVRERDFVTKTFKSLL